MQVVVDLVRCLADAVGPVVEHDDPFGIVGAGLGRIVHDHRQIQPVVGVKAGVWVGPVGARMSEGEPVGEVGAGADVRAGGFGAVHVVADRHAVPMHRGGVIEPVGDRDGELVADIGPNQRPGNRVAVGQRSGQRASQVNGGRLWRQCGGDGSPGMGPRRFGGGDSRRIRPYRDARAAWAAAAG